MLISVNYNSGVFSASQDPIVETKKIIDEINLLLEDPKTNQAQILALSEQLRELINKNPGSFSNIEKFDAESFCSGIEFSYGHSEPRYLGMAEGYFANLKLDFSQKEFPVIPPVSQQFLEDFYEVDDELSEDYPDTQKIQSLLADLKKLMPTDLPLVVKEKILMAFNRISQYLEDPTNDLNRGVAWGETESVLYVLWKEAPVPPSGLGA